MRAELALLACSAACGAAPVGPQPDAAAPDVAVAPACVTTAQLAAWQSEIDTFDSGYRPTGSPAHEQYIQLLTSELSAVGATDVHTEPYAFQKWTPASFALTVLGAAIPVSAFVPYSGTTGPAGVFAPLAYVPGWTIPIDATTLAGALADPSSWTQSLSSSIQATLLASAGALAGHIVVFELPRLALTLSTLAGTTLAVNDPGHTLTMDAPLERNDLSSMLVMPAMLTALASSGALAAVAILDEPEAAARGEYAPFFGTITPNLPALYVDRDTGAALAASITSHIVPPPATLVLDAVVTTATSENLIGVLPGASTQEIVIGSHTDGPNAMEDNGPVGVLALTQCLSGGARPRTLRFVLSGGHFAASVGLDTYVASHLPELTAHALAVVEIEHLGALEWAETTPGKMGPTGQVETQLVYATPRAPLVAASEAFAAGFPRSIVATPPVLGEGPNFRPLPLIQFITMPRYLLLRDVPVTSQLTDFDLMRRQVLGFATMVQSLSAAPL